MNSSNPFLQFLNDNDFKEIEVSRKRDAQQKAKQAAEAKRQEALPKLTEEDLKKADKVGFDRGVQEGIRQGEAQAQARFAEHFNELTARLTQLEPQLRAFQAINQKQAIQLTKTMVEQLMPAFLEKFPEEVLKTAIQRTFYYAPEKATLTVYMNPQSIEHLQKIENNPLTHQQDTRITISADESLAVGDCTIAWDESGIESRFQKAQEALLKLLEATKQGINANTVELPELDDEPQPQAESTADTAEETTPQTAEDTETTNA